MPRVETGSRLHFGLLAPCVRTGRRFGGAGLMIEQPGLLVTLEPWERDVIEGPLANRAADVLREIRTRLYGAGRLPFGVRIRVEHAAPIHVGLGTGTQLALAVAWAYVALLQREHRIAARGTDSAAELARLTNRGTRSGIGLHGFLHGGFLVDGGKVGENQTGGAPPLIARFDFPKDWRIVLAIPRGDQGLHGDPERDAFALLEPVSEDLLDRQCRRLLLGILPAIADQDYPAFAEALHEYNRDAGLPFKRVQRGFYTGRLVADRIALVRSLGIPATGQTSWGPTVFAIVPDADKAAWLSQRLPAEPAFADCQIVVTQARNRGACLNWV